MAEATGLVLGGVALVGLVSTCVEILEYLEDARNRAGDFRVALTKVSLIKQRLSDWGSDVDTCTLFDPESDRTTTYAHCEVVIKETLYRIEVLLEKTNKMSRRHAYRTPSRHRDIRNLPRSRTPAKFPFRSPSIVSDISLATNKRASFGTPHPRRPQLLLSLSLKVRWVFQDKKRFDSVIEQLDFLLSNLEKISETIRGRREMAQNSNSMRCLESEKNEGTQENCQANSMLLSKPSCRRHFDCMPNYFPLEANVRHLRFLVADQLEIRSGSDEEAERTLEDKDLVAIVSKSRDQSPHWNHTSQNGSGPLVLRQTIRLEQPPSNGAERPPHSHTDQQSGGNRETQEDPGSHIFIQCHSHHTSKYLRGNVGPVQKDLAGHEFNNCNSYDNSLSISGSMNAGVVTEILKSMDSRKEERAAHWNAEDRS